ncbi:hypothetical protein BDA99DRAFT_496340 [Phascolomyces articulosus]|uniref:Uncharacterized protein n=1 Tax=Phascolomyces articulosus TaxID=60185 RepID=A0AAD5KLZ9_9FUNG|nr:hypothetical protein BDA99DRAFT_496340 [Phascolomyces articulosus]
MQKKEQGLNFITTCCCILNSLFSYQCFNIYWVINYKDIGLGFYKVHPIRLIRGFAFGCVNHYAHMCVQPMFYFYKKNNPRFRSMVNA